MLIATLFSFFITLLVSFKNYPTQYRQRHIQNPIKDLRCSIWRQQSTVPETFLERSRTSKMKHFEKIIFSRSLFTQKALSQVFHFVLNTLLEPLTIFAIGSILMVDWVLDTPLTCLKKYKNCEKPVKELFLETLQQILRNNF